MDEANDKLSSLLEDSSDSSKPQSDMQGFSAIVFDAQGCRSLSGGPGSVSLLLAAVVVLPLMIKHDGSAQGFTQILLIYSEYVTFLSVILCGWLAEVWLEIRIPDAAFNGQANPQMEDLAREVVRNHPDQCFFAGCFVRRCLRDHPHARWKAFGATAAIVRK